MLLDEPESSVDSPVPSEVEEPASEGGDSATDADDSDYEPTETSQDGTVDSVVSLADSLDDNGDEMDVLDTAEVVVSGVDSTRTAPAQTSAGLSAREAAAAWANVFQKQKKEKPAPKARVERATLPTRQRKGAARSAKANTAALDADPSSEPLPPAKLSKTAKPPPPRPPPLPTVPLARAKALLRANPNVKGLSADATAAVAAGALSFLGMFVAAAGEEMRADGRKQLSYAHCARAVEAADAFSIGRVIVPPDVSDVAAFGDAAVVKTKRLRPKKTAG